MVFENNYHKIIRVPFILLLMTCAISAQEGKPDLVIKNVSSEKVFGKYETKPGKPVRAGNSYTTFVYTIEVTNIGTGSFSDQFYISWTNSDYDIDVGHYSGTSIVNYDKKTIHVGESMDIRISIPLFPSIERKFLINTDGQLGLKISKSFVDELSHENNTYIYKPKK